MKTVLLILCLVIEMATHKHLCDLICLEKCTLCICRIGLFAELFVGFADCRYKNQNIAVKIINKGETPEEISRREAQFGREVAMLSKVQHKNLVRVFFHPWKSK